MRYTFTLFFILLAFWALNSEYYTLFFLFWGMASVLLVLLIAYRMGLIDKESQPLHLVTRIAPYYLWLSKEIIIGSSYVLKRIILGSKAISPTIVTLKIDFKDELSKVIFANSITLVPGTLSMQLDRETIQVHALTRELAQQLASGEMARRIKSMED